MTETEKAKEYLLDNSQHWRSIKEGGDPSGWVEVIASWMSRYHKESTLDLLEELKEMRYGGLQPYALGYDDALRAVEKKINELK